MSRASIEQNRRYWNDDVEQWRPDSHQIMAADETPYGEERRRAIGDALADYTPLTGQWGLDLGGGQGVSVYLGSRLRTRRVLLGDLSRNMLLLSHNPDRVLLDAAAPALPLASETFDWATSFFLMRYLTMGEQENLVAEILRVLKPGGLALILDHQTIEHPMERALFEPHRLVQAYSPDLVTVHHLLEANFDLGISFLDDDARYLGPLYLLALTKPE